MPRSTKKNKGTRVNLEVAEKVRERMENLRDKTAAHSFTEVVSRALAVYDYLWQQRQAGAKVLLRDDDGDRELVLL